MQININTIMIREKNNEDKDCSDNDDDDNKL